VVSTQQRNAVILASAETCRNDVAFFYARIFMIRLQLKSDTSGYVAGYASVFGVVDLHGDLVSPGAYDRSIASWQKKGYQPPILWQHEQNNPIGAIHALREDSTGLWFEGQLAMRTRQGAEAHELLSMKSIGGLSIGYVVPGHGSESHNGIRYLNEIDLQEISVVTRPSNAAARVVELKHIESKIELEQLLRTSGLSRAAAKAVCARGYDGLDQDTDENLEALAASLNALNNTLRN